MDDDSPRIVVVLLWVVAIFGLAGLLIAQLVGS